MCKSKAQGGQRCFGHANQRFDKAMAAVAKAQTKGDSRLRAAQTARDEAAIQLASTSQGQARILSLADAARAAGQHAVAGMYDSYARQGESLRDQNTAVARAMASRRSLNPLTRRAEADDARRQAKEYQRVQEFVSSDDDDDDGDVSDSAYARGDLSGRLNEWAATGGFDLNPDEQKASFAQFVGEEASARFDSYLSDDEQEDTWQAAQRRADRNRCSRHGDVDCEGCEHDNDWDEDGDDD